MKKQKKIIIVATMLLTIVVSTLGYLVVNHLIPLEITGETTGYTEIPINSTSWWANYQYNVKGERADKLSELSVGHDIQLNYIHYRYRSVICFDNIESMLPYQSNQYKILEAKLWLYPTTSTDTADSRLPNVGWDICKLKKDFRLTNDYWMEDTEMYEPSASWIGSEHPLGNENPSTNSIWKMVHNQFPMVFDLTSDVQNWHSEFVSKIQSTNYGWVFKLNSENYDTRSQFPVNTAWLDEVPKLVIKWEKVSPVEVNLGVFPENFTSKGITITVSCPEGIGFYDNLSNNLAFPIDGVSNNKFLAWNNSDLTFGVDKPTIDTNWKLRFWEVANIGTFSSFGSKGFIMNLSDSPYTITAVYIDTSQPPSTVVITSTTGGIIVPNGTITRYTVGSTIGNIIATAAEGYKFDYLTRNDKKIGSSDGSTKIAQVSGSSKTSITIMNIAASESIKIYFAKDDLLTKILGEWLPFEIAGIIAVAALVIFVKRVQRRQVTQ